MKTITTIKEVVVKQEVNVYLAEFKDFENFLIFNDALSKYAKAIAKTHNTLDIKSFVLHNYRPTQAIDCAFTWTIQPEGTHYWESLSNKWDEWLDTRDIKPEDDWGEV